MLTKKGSQVTAPPGSFVGFPALSNAFKTPETQVLVIVKVGRAGSTTTFVREKALHSLQAVKNLRIVSASPVDNFRS